MDGTTDFNPFKELFGLAGRALDVKLAQASNPLGEQGDPRLGVDEYGRAYVRGAPTGFFATVPPVVLVGAGVLAAALLVYLLKR